MKKIFLLVISFFGVFLLLNGVLAQQSYSSESPLVNFLSRIANSFALSANPSQENISSESPVPTYSNPSYGVFSELFGGRFSSYTQNNPVVSSPFSNFTNLGPSGLNLGPGQKNNCGPGVNGFLNFNIFRFVKTKITPQGLLAYILKGNDVLLEAINLTSQTPHFVDFCLNGQPIAEVTSPEPGAPGIFHYVWDTTTWPNDYSMAWATALFSRSPLPNWRAMSNDKLVIIDNEPPVIEIFDPKAGDKISGDYVVKVKTKDRLLNVTEIELYADGQLERKIFPQFQHDYDVSYSLTWFTDNYSIGSHDIEAWSYDEAGNIGKSAKVTVQVARLPKVKFISPLADAFLKGIVNVVIEALPVDSAHPIQNVWLSVDSPLPGLLPNPFWGALPALPIGGDRYQAVLDTRIFNDGFHKLFALAIDSAGLMGKANISVTFDNTSPIVKFIKPINHQTYSGNININITASDNSGQLTLPVELTIWDPNGKLLLKKFFNKEPFSTIFNSARRDVPNGWLNGHWFNLIAKATDKVGNKGSASIEIAIDNGPSPTLSCDSQSWRRCSITKPYCPKLNTCVLGLCEPISCE